MIIAVASGKGGTGKTTVAAGLARVWPRPVVAVDFDVEAPNLDLFLNATMTREIQATLPVPRIDPALCTGCGACRDACAFNALAMVGPVPMLFPELCHACGGCLLRCPTGALVEDQRLLGEVLEGRTPRGGRVFAGRLRIGEAHAPPLMRKVRVALRASLAQEPADVLIDAPPGASCPALEAVRDADLVVLVTEPTPFGLHDLRLAWGAMKGLGRRMAVVINRAGFDDQGVRTFCAEAGLPVLAALPFDRDVAEAYARGRTLDEVGPEHAGRLRALAQAITALATPSGETAHA
ncbi:nucleotide-binding protein [Pararhodospirillum oryzae]|uniref:Cobyrinic acid a,c-diamide synthase n=1 Tax=Pararhodospirillum oryzae TaxID=478448 RepID=A0A512H8V8_9PROT|nr:ATP-binding protein [Pararhodospirillum oryzae]GEO81879.1 cobyrinic acid a,c-diamide synthase [Pararhodospirillum oryzae]